MPLSDDEAILFSQQIAKIKIPPDTLLVTGFSAGGFADDIRTVRREKKARPFSHIFRYS